MAIIKKIYTKTKDDFIIIELESGKKVVMARTDKSSARNKLEDELINIEGDTGKIDRVTDRGENFNSLKRAVLEKVDDNYELRIVHGGKTKAISAGEAKLIIIA